MSIRMLTAALVGAAITTVSPLGVSAQDALVRAPAPSVIGPPEGLYGVEGTPPLVMLAERLETVREHYTGVWLRLSLAAALSVQETAIGITSEQQEVWRAYTNALLALVPERERVLALLGAPDGKDAARGPEAFGRAEALADTLIAYAAKAQALKVAVTNLRSKLTAQQLEAARIPRLHPGIAALGRF